MLQQYKQIGVFFGKESGSNNGDEGHIGENGFSAPRTTTKKHQEGLLNGCRGPTVLHWVLPGCNRVQKSHVSKFGEPVRANHIRRNTCCSALMQVSVCH